jgi:hypothetical protein
VAWLQELPNDVKVAAVALVLIVVLAVLLYLQYEFNRRRG